MAKKIDVPQLLKEHDPFADTMIELITATEVELYGESNPKKVFPDENYSNLEVEIKLNGIEVPTSVVKELFHRHAKAFAHAMIRDKLNEITDPVKTKLYALEIELDSVIGKVMDTYEEMT